MTAIANIGSNFVVALPPSEIGLMIYKRQNI